MTSAITVRKRVAITGLGLVEGIANLPQLLLHPLALALAAGTVILAIHSSSGLAWCQTATCWSSYVHVAAFTYGVFLLVAIVGGLLGSVVLALSFGLNWRLAVQSLVSRVLVSYSPLNPADAYFRGVSELPLGLLLHSQIYRSKSAMAEISNWLKLIR